MESPTENWSKLLTHRSFAVITIDEDVRLNKVARCKSFESPAERWAAVGIEFPVRHEQSELHPHDGLDEFMAFGHPEGRQGAREAHKELTKR
jgi:hypothetical protein